MSEFTRGDRVIYTGAQHPMGGNGWRGTVEYGDLDQLYVNWTDGPGRSPSRGVYHGNVVRDGPTVVPLTPEEDAELRDELELGYLDQAESDLFEDKVATLFAEASNLLLSKHADYGPLNIALSPGGPINGLRVRLYDKLARLNNLVDTGAEPRHESLEDTWRDIIGYGAIGLLVTRGDWPDA